MMPNGNKRDRIYTREGLEAFNLLEHPVWVFDIEEKGMWWANDSALVLWNADTLESLLQRSFSEDMSEATERRLAEYLVKFRKGGTVQEQWTLYPQGKGATTVPLTLSGIRIENGRLAMMAEGILDTCQEQVDKESLRGVEMLRHLPVAVCQFDMEGRVMYQNPESFELFGSSVEESESNDENPFISRFKDEALGKKALKAVSKGCRDYCIEAQQHTKKGLRWFSISLKMSKDPVTSESVILYNARDITELIEAKRESEFFAVVAHEIRTPLHQVVGFLELLSQTELVGPQEEYVGLMQSSSMSLMSVINDLLDFTRIESGKLQLESIPFEVKGVMEGCQQVVLPRAKQKGVNLNCKIPVGLPVKLMGDPNRLRQILLNLLQNAVKFTHTGSITLAVSKVLVDNGTGRVQLRFEVEDTGIGISPEHQELIFQKYQQAGVSIASSYGGTGLGLAICKSLVDAMGGTISLESDLGRGTKFSFDIAFDVPVKNVEPAEEKLDSDADIIKGLHILVVEDNKMNQKVVTAMLRRMGHFSTVAENGAVGVEKIEKGGFDLVLMDVQMPVMDGIEATKQIRSRGWSESTLPVVGLTASYQPADRQYYRDIGMNDCIGKPVRINTLKKVLSDVKTFSSSTASNGETSCMEMLPPPLAVQ
jgi:PAS domain S-box-containing protein